MQTATRALIWRQWRMTRIPGLVTILFAVSLMLTDILLHKLNIINEDELILSAFAFTFGTFFFALFTLLLDSDFSNISAGFPKTLFGLPLRSSRLAVFELAGRTVAVIAVSGLMCIALLAANWIGSPTFEWGLNTDKDFQRDILQILFVFLVPVAVYTFVQVVYWYPGGVQVLIGIVLMMALVSPIRNAFIVTVQAIGEMSLTARILLLLVSIGLSYAAACGAVHIARRGLGANSIAELPFQIPSFRMESRSPLLAQCWYEWRSFGRALPGVTLLILSLLLAGIYQAFSNIGPANAPTEAAKLGAAMALLSSIYAPACISIAAFIIGVLLLSRDFQERGKLGTFVYVRPVRTRTLAVARLRAGFAGLGSAACLCLLIVAGLHLTSGSSASQAVVDQLTQMTGADSLVPPALSYAAVVLITAWVLLWLGAPMVLTVIAVVYPLAICAELAESWKVPVHFIEVTMRTVIILLPFGLILASGAVAARAVKTRTLARQDLLKGLVAWILVGIFFHYYATVQAIRPSSGDPMKEMLPWLLEESIIWSLAFLPVLPALSVPLTIKWLRHR